MNMNVISHGKWFFGRTILSYHKFFGDEIVCHSDSALSLALGVCAVPFPREADTGISLLEADESGSLWALHDKAGRRLGDGCSNPSSSRSLCGREMLEDDSGGSKQNIMILYLNMASVQCSGCMVSMDVHSLSEMTE